MPTQTVMLHGTAAHTRLHTPHTPTTPVHKPGHARPRSTSRGCATAPRTFFSNTSISIGSLCESRASTLSARLKVQAVQQNVVETAVPSREYTYTIPAKQSLSAHDLEQAQAAAEAEHVKLMTTGPLANEISRGNKQLQGIMSSYSTLQRLYHKAFMSIVKRYSQLATSNVDLAYIIYCEQLGKALDKQPGDTISSAELQHLSAQLQSTAGTKQDQYLLHFADNLCKVSTPNPIRDICVMPDMIKLLVAGFTSADSAISGLSEMLTRAAFAEGQSGKGRFDDVASATIGETLKWFQNQAGSMIGQLVVAMCQPASAPPKADIAQPAFQLSLSASMRSTRQMSNVIDSAFGTLPASDQPELLHASSQLLQLLSTSHSNAGFTIGIRFSPGSVFCFLTASCLFTYWAAVMRKTAMEQLSGSWALDDWKPVDMALFLPEQFLFTEAESWLLVQSQLATLAAQPGSMNGLELMELLQKINPGVGAGGLWGFDAMVATVDLLRFNDKTERSRVRKPYNARPSEDSPMDVMVLLGVRSYMSMLLAGMLQVIDSQYCCWTSVWYWKSLVTLSLQQTGGRQGPQAVAVAEQLMKEKHSVFVAKLCLQQVYAYAAASNTGLVSACQLPPDPEASSLVVARGDRSKVATLNTFKQTPPASWPENLSSIYQQACTVHADKDTDGDSATGASALLRVLGQATSLTVKDLLRIFAETTVYAAGADMMLVDKALLSAYDAWIGFALSNARSVHHTGTKAAEHIWFAAGLAQHHIYTQSSSKEVAQLMLGPGAVGEQYVRPLETFLQMKAASAGQLNQQVCNFNWDLRSKIAAKLLDSRIPCYGPPTLDRVNCAIWLTAAALSRPDLVMDDERTLVAVLYSFLTAYRAHFESAEPPQTFQLVQKALDAILSLDDERPSAVCGQFLRTLVFGSPPFERLEPPAQAMMQVAVTRWLARAPQITTAQLEIISKVPLLHADDYEVLLNKAVWLAPESGLSQIWSAAISASTDPQLSVTPAFGGQRPDEEWLVGQLKRLMTKKVESPGKVHAALLEPMMNAAQQLIQDQAAVDAARPAGWLMLDGVCSVLVGLDWTDLSERLLQHMLSLLRSNQQLDRPCSLVSAISVAAAAGAAAGDLKYYHLAVQRADVLKLTADNIKSIRSAATKAAAEQAAADESFAPSSQATSTVLLELWSAVISATQARSAGDSAVSQSAAAAVVRVMKQDPVLAEQLWQPNLPLLLLADLVKAAVAYTYTGGLQLLLQHARQHDQLQQLPTLMTHSAMCGLLSMLSTSSTSTGVQDSWEVYLLLQRSWQSGAWPTAAAVTAVPFQTFSALLQQQGNAGHTDRVLQLWSDNASSDVTKLSSDARSVVLSALVKSDQQQEAVDLVEQVPQQLGLLVTLWQQQKQQHIDAVLYLQALQLAVTVGNADAAVAVGRMLDLIQQNKQARDVLVADTETSVQLVHLLSKYGTLQAAKTVLVDYVLGGDQPLAAAATALADFVHAVATQTLQQQQQEKLVMQLAVSEQQQHSSMQDVLQAALDKALLEPQSATVALLLSLLYRSSGGRQLPLLLTSDQLDQLCHIIREHSTHTSSSSTDAAVNTLTTLPTAADLAQRCIESNAGISPTAAVTLINSIAAAESDLQPARAAEWLGLLRDRPAGAAAAAEQDAVRYQSVCRSSMTIAHLCYFLVVPNSSNSGADDGSDDMSSSLSWVSQLSREAASAALFATWYWAQPEAVAAAVDSGAINLTIRPPLALVLHELCRMLYQTARGSSRPTLDSLLLDIMLAAAAAAQQWDEGAAVISKAERALTALDTDNSSTSKGGRPSSTSAAHWVPLLPAALEALPAVMVHTQGVEHTAQLLLSMYEEQQAQQQEQQQQPVRRRSRGPAATTAVRPNTVLSHCHSLLSPACISSFLSASVDVATAAAASGDGDAAQSAAAEAVKVAHALFGKQLVAAKLAANSDNVVISSTTTTSSSNDTSIYSSLLQLYGLTGQLQQVADITMAAVHDQLRPLGESRSSSSSSSIVISSSAALQQVLAGSAAALLSAAAAVVFDLLDGLTAAGVEKVTDKQLVERLIQAAEAVNPDKVQQALSCRLSGGSEAAETFMLCSNPDEVAQFLGGGGVDDVDNKDSSNSSNMQVYLQLVVRQGLEPLVLKQQLQQRLRQAVQQLVE